MQFGNPFNRVDGRIESTRKKLRGLKLKNQNNNNNKSKL